MKTNMQCKSQSWIQSKQLLALPAALRLLLLGVSATQLLAASADVDLSFDPGAAVNDYVNAVVIQGGGRTLIGGQFTLVHDAPFSYAAWLKTDGSPDLTMQAGLYDDGHLGCPGGVYSAALQPDGKLLLGGSFVATNQARNLVRLNADASVDTSFSAGAFTATVRVVESIAVQSDGKVVLLGEANTGGVLINRLNTDGSLDSSFVVPSLAGYGRCIVQPDDKTLVGGSFTAVNGVARANLARLNADGSVDSSFSAPSCANAPGAVLRLQSDGKIVIGRTNSVVRLNADGSLDSTFAAYWTGCQVASLALQSDGKILCGGYNCGSIARLNPDGSRDNSFSATLVAPGWSWVGGALTAMTIQGDGKIMVGGAFTTVNGVSRINIARLNADGSLDTSFLNGPGGVSGDVNSLALQNDGKVLIGGWFTSINGASRRRIARLNADGSLDNSFLAGGGGAEGQVGVIALQPDNKVLIGGDFTFVNGIARGRTARLWPDGSLDDSFLSSQAGANYAVSSIVVQNDGKIIIAGSFSRFNGVPANSIARLNTDGSLDSFSVSLTGGHASQLLLQPDGKILVAGDFSAVNGVSRGGLARLDSNGSLDSSFWPANGGYRMALQPDGKILLASSGPYVARLNTDGSSDASFNFNTLGPLRGITSLALQSDGKLLVGDWPGGPVGVRTNLVRLNADGTWDSSFVCFQSLPPNGVGCIARQPDGKFLIGGLFGVVNQVVRPNLVRLMGENAPLEILTPPQSQTAEIGTAVEFTIGAAGTPTLTYLWLLNGTNVVGCGPNCGLQLTGVQPGAYGAYTVVVTNLSEAVTSAPAMLNVIPPVARTAVLGIKLTAEAGSTLNLDYTHALSPPVNWVPLETVVLTNPPRYNFDPATPTAPQRFYRTWQTGTPSVPPALDMTRVPSLTLTGSVGSKVRVDGINQFGPIDAWFTLATVTLTNTSQLYFDVSVTGQPNRLYRLVPVP